MQTALAQCLQHLPAIQAGQHHIQNQQVVLAVQRKMQSIGAISR
jgi:hypothetical protein